MSAFFFHFYFWNTFSSPYPGYSLIRPRELIVWLLMGKVPEPRHVNSRVSSPQNPHWNLFPMSYRMLRHNPLVTFQNPSRGGGDDNVIGRGGRFVLRNETWYLVLVLLLCLVSPTSEFVLFLFFFLVFFFWQLCRAELETAESPMPVFLIWD